VIGKFARIQSEDRVVNQLQSNVAQVLDPVTANIILSGIFLKSVPLIAGANTISHKLGRRLTGWFVTRKRVTADVWDTQDSNKTPNLNLILNASTGVTVDLYVF